MTKKQKLAQKKLLAQNKSKSFYHKNRRAIKRFELTHSRHSTQNEATACGLLIEAPIVLATIPTCASCSLEMMRGMKFE